jgi:hypothetical protein
VSAHKTPQERIDRAGGLYDELKSTPKVAHRMGCSEAQARRYILASGRVLDGKGGHPPVSAPRNPPGLELPQFPDEDIPVEELIALQCRRFTTRQASYDAHTWFPVKVTDKKPIGILWFGDPHVDDNGCNWPTLNRDIALCRDTEGLYGANIGDTTNNWAGRLSHLYAKQDSSVGTARRLAKWFLLEAGVPWLVWIYGNHDAWGDGSEVLGQMAKQHGTQKVVCHDWEARFRLVFKSGWEPRIYAAHDFKGHSMWNPLHGPMKAGQMGDGADLYVCGDKHNWACFEFENAARGRRQTFVRVRGYKFMDEYARRLGLHEQKEGCAAVTVFDPDRQQITSFSDAEVGADFLKHLRAKAK